MSLWSKGVERSRTAFPRTEEISSVISACNKTRDFINLLCEKKLSWPYKVCDYKMSNHFVDFMFHTDTGNKTVSFQYSPNDFDYSVYMYLNQKIKMIENNEMMYEIGYHMSNNLHKYLEKMLDGLTDYSVLFEI